MLHLRLTLALNEGRLVLGAQHKILVIGPQRDHDLSSLPKEHVVIYSPYFPVNQVFKARGYEVVHHLPDAGFDVAIVCAPRSKAQALAWIYAASRATSQGLVVIDGQKTDGIDSLIKHVKKETDCQGPIVKAHGKLSWFTGGDFQKWAMKKILINDDFVTFPGIFSAEKVDKGSQVLVDNLPEDLSGDIADLGAGWGYLSKFILENQKVRRLDLIEADYSALDAAKQNITDARANFFWNDATDFQPSKPYDVVISNPPFHETRAGDPEIGRAFIRHAARILKPSGRIIIVANRHLPYEQTLAECFQNVNNSDMFGGFKILSARKPKRLSR